VIRDRPDCLRQSEWAAGGCRFEQCGYQSLRRVIMTPWWYEIPCDPAVQLVAGDTQLRPHMLVPDRATIRL
jgi:hypothetical protein